MLLNLKDIKVKYDKAEAIKGVSIEIEEGHITGLIGANGAGKSTILKAISGLVKVSAGEMYFQDKKINNLEMHKIVSIGDNPDSRRDAGSFPI